MPNTQKTKSRGRKIGAALIMLCFASVIALALVTGHSQISTFLLILGLAGLVILETTTSFRESIKYLNS